MKHLHAVYSIEQITTIPHNLHGNATCKRFNCTLMDLLKSLSKEQKGNWLLYLPSLIFAYSATQHSMTGYQPYKLIFGCKATTISEVWLGLANCYYNYLKSKCEWVNQQHELIHAANRHALKRIKLSAENQSPGHDIPVGNLVLLYDHSEGQNKIQDNYKSKQFVMELKHWDHNV